MTYNCNCRILAVCRSDDHRLCFLLKISFFVGNCKCNVVRSVCQNHFLGNHQISGSLGRNRITIDIDLSCRIVQSRCVIDAGAGCVISNRCREHCVIGRNRVSIENGNINRTEINLQIVDNGHITVTDNRAVIKGNIINKEGHFLIEFIIRVNDKFNERWVHITSRSASRIRRIWIHKCNKILGRNINVNVSPAALRDASLCHSVIRHFLIVHHDLTVLSAPCLAAVLTIGPKDTGTDIYGILRDIHPHTNTASSISVGYVT